MNEIDYLSNKMLTEGLTYDEKYRFVELVKGIRYKTSLEEDFDRLCLELDCFLSQWLPEVIQNRLKDSLMQNVIDQIRLRIKTGRIRHGS